MGNFLRNRNRSVVSLRIVLSFVAILISSVIVAQEFRYQESWGPQGLTKVRESNDGLSLNFSLQNFSMEDVDINGVRMKNILFSESLLPGEEGYPDLPSMARYIAIPQGSVPIVEVTDIRVEKISNVLIAPAPRIPLDTETGPLRYSKNESAYSRNAVYPSQIVTLGDFSQIRGVDVCMLSINPYQYNPVTKELVVVRDIKFSVKFEGGSKQFGDNKYRNPYWDQILEDVIYNYTSLPKVDYNNRYHDRDLLTGYEYLIVVPNDPIFSQYADSIKKFRNEQGIYTGIVKLSDIGTSVNAATLRTYFSTAYNTWDIPPVAVLLLGDYGSNNANTITSPIYDNYCVSDNILSDINNDDMPEIIFARMTAQNEQHLKTMTEKFMNYERKPPVNPDFYSKPITALGWQTERWFQLCSEVVGGFWRSSLGKTPVRINEVYSGSPGSVWSTATNTNTVVGVFGPNGMGYIPQTPALMNGWTGGNATQINNAMNAGSFMLMHRDHGMETGWGEPYYTNSNISGLTNTDLTWVLSINCLTGKYNWNQECFTEKFHRYTYNGNPAGALGLTAASETSYSFVNDVFVWGMMDNMWPEFMTYGSQVEERGILPSFGQAAGKFFLKQSNWPYNVSNKQVTYNLFHHHGDAFVRICTEVPDTIIAAHDNEIYESATGMSVTTALNSTICISSDGVILGTAISTESETVELQFDPQPVGTILKLTITRQNSNRYEAYITVVADVTAANAGEDAISCDNNVVPLIGLATNYESVEWQTSGTGTFDDPTILNTLYTPGAEDVAAGMVTLSLTAFNPALGDSTDYVQITFLPEPQITAINGQVCAGDTYTTETLAEDYTYLSWSTNGTGTFENSSVQEAIYTPGPEDIEAGQAVLVLTIGNGVCEDKSADITLQINPLPVVSINGPAELCQFDQTASYSASGNENTYVWIADGGTITSGETEAEVWVNWTIADTVSISLSETNQFGCVANSSMEVVVKASPEPVITGGDIACANSAENIYTAQITEGNTYTWNVTGGSIVSGENTQEITVQWNENGTGVVAITEANAENMCSNEVSHEVAIQSPIINLVSDTTICINHNINIGVEPGYASYNWSSGETEPQIAVSGEAIGAGNSMNYELTVTDTEGCATTAGILVIVEACTSIPEGLSESVVIYPNPNAGEFNIAFKEALKGNATIKIYHATGAEIYRSVISVQSNEQTETFSLGKLQAGIYYISIETQNGHITQKLMIK